MLDFTMLVAKCIAVMAAAALIGLIFYMPQELRQDLRNPRLCKKYEKEMLSELRWQKAIVGWRILFSLLLAMAVIAIIYLLASIPA